MDKELLRGLPKVDEIINDKDIKGFIENSSRGFVIEIIRRELEYYRNKIINNQVNFVDKKMIMGKICKTLRSEQKGNFKNVINATGVIIHTNLGRSLLSKEAAEKVFQISQGYSNLEYDLKKGARGSRYSLVEELIKKVTGAEAAMVVNNNAAAVMLVLNTLCKDKEAIVSRGQLVEIGGSFRIPDVMSFSGAKLIEVGTTNRTHLYDYENNINDNTGVILKVHTSNFKVLGFTEEVSLEELVTLGMKNNLPVIEDIGSGTLIDFSKYELSYEPTVNESIKRGVDIVTFSGDKMLGGPQAGIITGKKQYIDMMKKNQLTRALRIDKMTLAALEVTLKYYLDEKVAVEKIPTLNMILSPSKLHKNRAQRLRKRLKEKCKNFEFNICEDYSMVGGGSMPTEKINTYVIKVTSSDFSAVELEDKLRNGDTPVIVRVNKDEVILDLRTILDEDFNNIIKAFELLND